MSYKAIVNGRGHISAKMVADSISNDVRISTLELYYPRFIHSEFMTHRMFSRNASSSRAVPIEKVLKTVEECPAMPIHWGKNKPGMSADEECNESFNRGWVAYTREAWWAKAADNARWAAEDFMEKGYHKQIVNRLTEPFQFIKVIVTATEWSNFFKQRLASGAQPEIRELAHCMREVMLKSIPEEMDVRHYHLPYISDEEMEENNSNMIKASIARCARVSYLNHDKSLPDLEKDVNLYNFLIEHGHFSPFEHVATPMDPEAKWNTLLPAGYTHQDRLGVLWSGNFRGWLQRRQEIANA